MVCIAADSSECSAATGEQNLHQPLPNTMLLRSRDAVFVYSSVKLCRRLYAPRSDVACRSLYP